MSEPINLLVLDLSHYDVPCDLGQAKAAGIEGVIWKATEGTGFFDNTYYEYRQKAEAADLLWGAYHFANGSDALEQAEWFCEKAQITEVDLFVLDWEPYSSQMRPEQAEVFVQSVEDFLDRLGECVIYGSSSFLTDQIPKEQDAFFGARRLWLAQYGPTPKVPPTWDKYWLWQYAADSEGPEPHTVAGIPGKPDVNSYPGSAEQLRAEWSGGSGALPKPNRSTVYVTINAPPGIEVRVIHAETRTKLSQSK